MKKALLLTLVLIFALQGVVLAQQRGALQNTFASWVSVTATTHVVTFPHNSRDIVLANGSAVDVFVDLSGDDIVHVTPSTLAYDVFSLPAEHNITLQDFVTDKISFYATATASPVSVIVTY